MTLPPVPPVPADQLQREVTEAHALTLRLYVLVAYHRAQGPAATETVRYLEELHTTVLAFAEDPADPVRRAQVLSRTREFTALAHMAFAEDPRRTEAAVLMARLRSAAPVIAASPALRAEAQRLAGLLLALALG